MKEDDNMKKRIALLLVFCLLAGLLSGCKAPAEPEPEANAQEESSIPSTLALVVAGSFGDKALFDSAREGVDQLGRDSDMKVTTIECNNENYESQMRSAADQSDIVVCVGQEFSSIETVAPDYPDVKFLWIDHETSKPMDNVLNITYAQNEGAFLAGYIAAALSMNGCIGVVGGEDNDTVNDYIVGYRQGADAYNPEVRVEVNYTGTSDDAASGKECALALHAQGADIIFQAASDAGMGVFEAAREDNFYAIGADFDQKYIAPEFILCSMKKEVGQSIYSAVKAYMDGDASRFGTTWVAGLSDECVSIGYGTPDMEQLVPNPLKDQIVVMTEKIISGEITVDSTRQ